MIIPNREQFITHTHKDRTTTTQIGPAFTRKTTSFVRCHRPCRAGGEAVPFLLLQKKSS